MGRGRATKIKLSQNFLDTVTALLNTPPMPKDKRKAQKPTKKGKGRKP